MAPDKALTPIGGNVYRQLRDFQPFFDLGQKGLQSEFGTVHQFNNDRFFRRGVGIKTHDRQ